MINQTGPFYVPLERRGVLGIGGSEARTFLQNLISNDVRRLAPDMALYALLLTPQGKYLHDFFLAEHADLEAGTTLVLDVERDRAADLLRRLTLYKLRADVVLADLSDRYTVGAIVGAANLQLGNSGGAAQALGGGRSPGIQARDHQPRGRSERVLFPGEAADHDARPPEGTNPPHPV